MSTAIKVENLGKKYIIQHQHQQQSRYQYTSLAESLSRSFKNLGKNLLHPFRGDASFENTEEFWALKDINFEIKHGDRVGIIGRNGAGKSTLLKILSRITHPSTGKITINGRVSSLLEVGTGFHPELTGRENIFLNGAILGMRKQEIQRAFDEIVDFAEVEKFLDTPVKHYSSGMYVRLAFAVAAHLEPDILIVDEVLAVGDAQFQSKCLDKLKETSVEGKTVLFVSHNIAALRALCKNAILLDNGSLTGYEQLDTVASKYSALIEKKYRHNFKSLTTQRIEIKKIETLNYSNEELLNICSDLGFIIKLTYQVKEKGRIGFCICFSMDGQPAFISISNHDPAFYEIKNTGFYSTTCKIPDMLLNSGRYSISLTIFEENYANTTDFKDIMLITVEDSPIVRKDYFGGYVGMVRPKLEWSSIYLHG
ncbi:MULTISPECIES: ABC transporter ATP-binding protein [Methylomonas]|uniref:ABC transporter domain-containing protein n=2 Tax=Methylomonas TaxID=416 RepID=A0A140E5M7_9GAMM|nr:MULTISPECIES: ABC transporter ATP-binding protein [Methylomonas]AMK78701.1 hypothetical protein JT25_019775 [Methylomonas denitrificans]OAI03697.1 hypothetical protein A1342_01030 [Methylomonas methanica]